MFRLGYLEEKLNDIIYDFFGVEPVIKRDDSAIKISAEIGYKNIDNNIFLTIFFDDFGSGSIYFIFDKIDKSIDAYQKINDFNFSVSIYKAYIDHRDYLVLKREILDMNGEDQIIDLLSELMKFLSSDYILKYLKPIIFYTH